MMIVLRKIINDDNDSTDTEFDYIDKLSSNLLWRQVDTICLQNTGAEGYRILLSMYFFSLEIHCESKGN